MLDQQHLGCDTWGYRRVAIAVTAYPRAEAKWGSRELEDDAMAGKLVVEVFQNRRHGAVVQARQVIENILGLVLRAQSPDTDLARLPQQKDRFAETAGETSLLGGRAVGPECLYEVRHLEKL